MALQDVMNSLAIFGGLKRKQVAVDESFVECIVIDISCFITAPELFDHLFRSPSQHVISIPAIDFHLPTSSAGISHEDIAKETFSLIKLHQLHLKNRLRVLSSSGRLSQNFGPIEEFDKEGTENVIVESCRKLMRSLLGGEERVVLLTYKEGLRAKASMQNVRAMTPQEFLNTHQLPWMHILPNMVNEEDSRRSEGEHVGQFTNYVVLDTNVFISCLPVVRQLFTQFPMLIFVIPNIVYMELHNLVNNSKGYSCKEVGAIGRTKLQNDASGSIALIEDLLMASNGGLMIRGLNSSGSIHPRPLCADQVDYGDNDGIILDSCIRLRDQATLQARGVCLLTLDKLLRLRAALEGLVAFTPTELVNLLPLPAQVADVANGMTENKLD